MVGDESFSVRKEANPKDVCICICFKGGFCSLVWANEPRKYAKGCSEDDVEKTRRFEGLSGYVCVCVYTRLIVIILWILCLLCIAN